MTLKDFSLQNEITGLELYNDLLINVIANSGSYGLDVDTSNIVAGSTLIYTDDFYIFEDYLIYNNIQINMNEINMLS